MSAWYCIRTATRRERHVTKSLTEQGFAAFAPMETRWGQTGCGLREPKQRPLLPGYLFVLTPVERLAEVQTLEGVHQLVGYYDEEGISRALPIPLPVIIGMQAEERSGAYDRTRLTKAPYRPRKGDQVKVIRGPYITFMGRVLSTPKGDRAHVMLEGPFGRGVTLDCAQLSAA